MEGTPARETEGLGALVLVVTGVAIKQYGTTLD